MSTYPRDLVSLLKSRWRSQQKHIHKAKEIRLPSSKVLVSLLDISYSASFLTEERRRVGFSVILLSREKYLKDELRREKFKCRGALDKKQVIELKTPKPFSTPEVMRLALATDYTRMLICIQPAKNKKDYEIWGMYNLGSSWWDFIHADSSSGMPPPGAFMITVSKPGEIVISVKGFVLLRLNNGAVDYDSNSLFKDSIQKPFKKAQKDLHQATLSELKTKEYSRDDNEYPERSYTFFLYRLLTYIEKRNHGGTLVIVPDHIREDDTRLIDRISIKYPTKFDVIWPKLVEYLVAHRKYYDLDLKFWGSRKSIRASEYKRVSHWQMRIDEIEEELKDYALSISRLSDIDGAVVITDKFRLLGFGGEVIANSPALDMVTMRGRTVSTSASIENYGTRHRSAFRLCSSNEDFTAFVVSQDGGVKAIRRIGPDVCVWPNICLWASFSI